VSDAAFGERHRQITDTEVVRLAEQFGLGSAELNRMIGAKHSDRR